MPDIKLGSLFDGIGVFPLAASRCGIRPVWASEIEKAPISITKRHFPDMVHLGDITKVDGGKIPPVHVITFGSPCQNLSLIGNRSGLAGAKSSLFYQAFRIIQEMRDATDNLYPASRTFSLWTSRSAGQKHRRTYSPDWSIHCAFRFRRPAPAQRPKHLPPSHAPPPPLPHSAQKPQYA